LNIYAGQILKWGVDQELSPIIKIANRLQNNVEKKTNGRVKIVLETYDSDKIKEEFLAIRNDKFQIHQIEVDEYYSNNPSLKYWDIPFLFLNKDHVESYIESERSQKILASAEDSFRKHVTYSYAGGFLFLFSQERMNSMADLSGLVCESDGGGDNLFNHFLIPKGITRSPEGKRGERCAEILSSDLSLMFTELETGGYKHLTMTRHRVLPRVISISKKALRKMKPNDREVLISELKKFSKYERNSIYKGISDLKKILKIRKLSFDEWSLSTMLEQRRFFEGETKKYRLSLGKRANEEIDYIQELEVLTASDRVGRN
jgi:TRAP-type C4-dicarboxylate transport system substrate-binding protein